MKIDRHNYEEYFILYWDNELPEDQKREVEKFVSENDDLQDEFRLLGETRFSPDSDIHYNYKNFLLNDGDVSVNVSNYKEQLLSYIDDELTFEQKKQLEQFVSIHPAAQKELSLLQRVKLEPEAEIVFPDKSILYRREEKTPVIRLTWLRIAVAASVIIVAGLITFRLTTTRFNSTTEGLATTKQSDKGNLNKNEVKQPEPGSVASDKKANESSSKENANQESLTPASTNQLAASGKPSNKAKDRKLQSSSENNIETNQPVIAYTDVTEKQTGENVLRKPDNSSSNTIAYNEPVSKKDPFENTSVTERTSPSLNIDDGGEVLTQKEGGGLKEFLRKTTRVIERRTKIQTTTDDNKLLVGAFAVSLK